MTFTLLCAVVCAQVGVVLAICPNDNVPTFSWDLTAEGQSVTENTMFGGDAATLSTIAGATYEVSSCGTSWDTQLTIYNDADGSVVAYNDDACALQSTATFVATESGTVTVNLHKHSCQDYVDDSAIMTVTLVTLRSDVNACSDPVPLTCGATAEPFVLGTGNGQYNPSDGPWGSPGQEAAFSFTPTSSGSHTISTTNDDYYVDVFYQAGPCADPVTGDPSWTYIDDAFAVAHNVVELIAGTTYHFLLDDENTTPSYGTIGITCPVPPACESPVPLTCGATAAFLLEAGAGRYNPSDGPWGSPGQEAAFSFTPTQSGVHSILVTNDNYYVDLFQQARTCADPVTGDPSWTYIDDIFTAESNAVELIAGETYYFLLDDENTDPSAGTITVTCPVPAPEPCTVVVDATCAETNAYVLSFGEGQYSPGSIAGSPSMTLGQEMIFSYTPDFTGSYTIERQAGATGPRDAPMPTVQLFVSTSCSDSGWTYVEGTSASPLGPSTITTHNTGKPESTERRPPPVSDDHLPVDPMLSTMDLVAGVTYYFLLDSESAAATSAGTISFVLSGVAPTGTVQGPTEVSLYDEPNEYTYSISMEGGQSFAWSVPADAQILSGQGTPSITVQFGTPSGSVSVVASNACGANSASQDVAVMTVDATSISVEFKLNISALTPNDQTALCDAAIAAVEASFTDEGYGYHSAASNTETWQAVLGCSCVEEPGHEGQGHSVLAVVAIRESVSDDRIYAVAADLKRKHAVTATLPSTGYRPGKRVHSKTAMATNNAGGSEVFGSGDRMGSGYRTGGGSKGMGHKGGEKGMGNKGGGKGMGHKGGEMGMGSGMGHNHGEKGSFNLMASIVNDTSNKVMTTVSATIVLVAGFSLLVVHKQRKRAGYANQDPDETFPLLDIITAQTLDHERSTLE